MIGGGRGHLGEVPECGLLALGCDVDLEVPGDGGERVVPAVSEVGIEVGVAPAPAVPGDHVTQVFEPVAVVHSSRLRRQA